LFSDHVFCIALYCIVVTERINDDDDDDDDDGIRIRLHRKPGFSLATSVLSALETS